MTSWTADAEVRIRHLQEEMRRVSSQAGNEKEPRLTHARATLRQVEEHLAGGQRFRDALSGSGQKLVWGMLHEVEEVVDDVDHDVDALRSEAFAHIRNELPARRSSWEHDFAVAPGRRQATLARDVVHEAHVKAENKRTSELNHRRGVRIFSGTLLGLAVIVLGLQMATAVPFLPAPPHTETMPGAVTLLLVMLFGSLGGLLSGLVALYLAPTTLDNTRWFDLKPTLVFAKASIGLWTAVIGAAAVGTGTIVGVYTSLAALLLLAVIFGYSQQAITTFLDKRAALMLESNSP